MAPASGTWPRQWDLARRSTLPWQAEDRSDMIPCDTRTIPRDAIKRTIDVGGRVGIAQAGASQGRGPANRGNDTPEPQRLDSGGPDVLCPSSRSDERLRD